MAATDTREANATMIGLDERSSALDLVPVEERNLRGLELADRMFDQHAREQVAQLLAVPADSPALMPYLALCIAEGFSPWANHVWLIPKKVKIKAANGEEEREETKHLPAVGRDGLLHRARQTQHLRAVGAFRGLRANVVCEHDTFEVEDDGENVRILHRFASKPTEFPDGESPDRYRGRVIGAWAKLKQADLPSTFYFANLREHGRLRHVWEYNESARRRQPLFHAPGGGVTFASMSPLPGGGAERNRPVQEWEGAWDYLSTMILKSAQSYVLRIGMGVTGFVPVDELRNVEEWQEGAADAAADVVAGSVAEFDLRGVLGPETSADVAERVERAITAANAQDPFAWPPAKCEMVLSNRSESELLSIVEQIEGENEQRDVRADRASKPAAAAPKPEPEPEPAGDPAREGEIQDADVVGESELDRLRALADDLARQISSARSETEEAHARVELEQVETRIRELGGRAPGQESLGV
jgi:hypothetical protein